MSEGYKKLVRELDKLSGTHSRVIFGFDGYGDHPVSSITDSIYIINEQADNGLEIVCDSGIDMMVHPKAVDVFSDEGENTYFITTNTGSMSMSIISM